MWHLGYQSVAKNKDSIPKCDNKAKCSTKMWQKVR
jgi:hypothetical protein